MQSVQVADQCEVLRRVQLVLSVREVFGVVLHDEGLLAGVLHDVVHSLFAFTRLGGPRVPLPLHEPDDLYVLLAWSGRGAFVGTLWRFL